ncbi:uncharacterized protein BDV17DRAFT_245590 [Aspergillus undulatus]|uniref:uncharacterized protein n=1 Tax=Aspergillus undulatus TaxID=1810928 RepID=UPI003CCE2697
MRQRTSEAGLESRPPEQLISKHASASTRTQVPEAESHNWLLPLAVARPFKRHPSSSLTPICMAPAVKISPNNVLSWCSSPDDGRPAMAHLYTRITLLPGIGFADGTEPWSLHSIQCKLQIRDMGYEFLARSVSATTWLDAVCLPAACKRSLGTTLSQFLVVQYAHADYNRRKRQCVAREKRRFYWAYEWLWNRLMETTKCHTVSRARHYNQYSTV